MHYMRPTYNGVNIVLNECVVCTEDEVSAVHTFIYLGMSRLIALEYDTPVEQLCPFVRSHWS